MNKVFLYVDDIKHPLIYLADFVKTRKPGVDLSSEGLLGTVFARDMDGLPIELDLVYFKSSTAACAWVLSHDLPVLASLDYDMASGWDPLPEVGFRTTEPVVEALYRKKQQAPNANIRVECHSGNPHSQQVLRRLIDSLALNVKAEEWYGLSCG